jgi:hypothetical protein
LEMLDLRQVAAALGGVVSNGQILAPGPGHSREDRSLSVKIVPDAPDGFIVYSHAGDDPIACKNYVREKCGLPAFQPNGCRRRRSSEEIEKLLSAAVDTASRPKGTLIATFRYTDLDRTLLYEVLKYADPKRFVQRRPDGKRGWIYDLQDQRRVIYRWPYIAATPGTVFITEGEKDADRVIEQLQYPATTAASGKWTPDCIEALRGRDCWIFEDNDDAGRKKALDAAKNLYGTAASVRIIKLPGLPEHGDISDWLDAGHGIGELEEIFAATPDWDPEVSGDAGIPAAENISPAVNSVAAETVPTPLILANTSAWHGRPEPPPVYIAPWNYHGENATTATPWLIKNILPETGTTLISGQWGSYKTTVALDIAIAVMTGNPFAGKFKVQRQGGVAYLALEGAGGLASRLDAIATAHGSTGLLPFAYRSDCPALTGFDAGTKIKALVDGAANHLKDTFNAELVMVVFDTVVTAAGYARIGDENDAAMAQKVMTAMAQLSNHTGALVVGIDHFGKVQETGTRGSSAKEAHADAVIALLADREINGSVSNTRLAIRKLREGQPGLELPFTPKTIEVGTDPDGDPITRVVIDWSSPAQDVQSSSKDWSKSLQLLRRILMTILAECGEDIYPFAGGPMVRAVKLDLVRTEFLKQYVADGEAAKRSAFNRAIKSAQGKELVVVREISGVQVMWLASNSDRNGGQP